MRTKKASAKAPPIYLQEDERSFTKPFDGALTAAVQAFLVAAATVSGAEARTRAATNELNSLHEFDAAVEAHMRAKSFHDLPGYKRGRERLNGIHHMTVGPWRGVFLVSADGTQVIALVFSKFPHSLENRLDEVVEAYRTKDHEEPEGGSSPE